MKRCSPEAALLALALLPSAGRAADGALSSDRCVRPGIAAFTAGDFLEASAASDRALGEPGCAVWRPTLVFNRAISLHRHVVRSAPDAEMARRACDAIAAAAAEADLGPGQRAQLQEAAADPQLACGSSWTVGSRTWGLAAGGLGGALIGGGLVAAGLYYQAEWQAADRDHRLAVPGSAEAAAARARFDEAVPRARGLGIAGYTVIGVGVVSGVLALISLDADISDGVEVVPSVGPERSGLSLHVAF